MGRWWRGRPCHAPRHAARRRDGDIAPYRNGTRRRVRGEETQAVRTATGHGRWRGQGRVAWWCAPRGCNGGRARCPYRAARVMRVRHCGAKMRATRGYWGLGRRALRGYGGLGRRALRGYGGLTETPPAKLSACATCHTTHRADGAAARWGHGNGADGMGRWWRGRPCHAPRRWRGGAMGTSRPTATGHGNGDRTTGRGASKGTRQRCGARRDKRCARPRDTATGHGRWRSAMKTAPRRVAMGAWRRLEPGCLVAKLREPLREAAILCRGRADVRREGIRRRTMPGHRIRRRRAGRRHRRFRGYGRYNR